MPSDTDFTLLLTVQKMVKIPFLLVNRLLNILDTRHPSFCTNFSPINNDSRYFETQLICFYHVETSNNTPIMFYKQRSDLATSLRVLVLLICVA